MYNSIEEAEREGYRRCCPYEEIGVSEPRWYHNGFYYKESELVSPQTYVRPNKLNIALYIFAVAVWLGLAYVVYNFPAIFLTGK